MSNPNLKSNQGQQASELRLAFEDLTENEQQLVSLLGQEGRPTFTIKGMMEELGWHLGRTGRARGNSRVRNTLRRLVRSHWVGHKSEIGDGNYRITLQGLNRLKKLAETVENDNKETPKPRKHKPKTKAAPAPTETKPANEEATPAPAPAPLPLPAPLPVETKPATTETNEEEF